MQARGMNARVQRLRALSVDTQPRICMERARIETEVYRDFQGKLSVPELRAMVLLRYQQTRTLYLGEDELIVGEKASAPQAAPTFPELCCHTQADLQIMNDRPLISFSVTLDDRALQAAAIEPYWTGRSMREKLLSLMDADWKACYEAGIFTEFMEQRGPGHTVGSYKLYEKGFLDYQADIDAAIASLDWEADANALAKLEQLRGMRLACEAIMTLGTRYADLARERAALADGARREELLQIAENCTVVPAHRPQTFWQAIQMYWFVHLCVTTELNPWDAYSPGRLDQHLNPFYRKDCAAGILDEPRALELLECLWVKFNNQPAPPKVGVTLKESGSYTDFANINTGGVTPEGADAVNDVSYLILDCMDEMQLLQPSSNVQISRKTPQHFLRRACEISRKGWGQPAFYNTEAIIQELLNAGKSLKDARMGGASGCVETGAFGNEAYILTGYFNLPKVLDLTLHDGFDRVTGQQLGLHCGHAADFDSFERLYEAFEAQLRHLVDIKLRGSNRIEQLYARSMPVPFLSILTNDCIEKGRDYNAGGARYNTSYLQGVGIATVTDSLMALWQHVYNGQLDMDTLQGALDVNFEGCERVRVMLSQQTHRYGNDDDAVDGLMRRIFHSYLAAVQGRPNMRGGMYRVNMLPTTCHVYFGEMTGATPDGRRAHMPLSEGISPVQGADTQGPTAVLRSAAKMDQLMTGGTLLNQKFTPAVLAGETGLARLADLIRTYFDMDGHHIQFNVVDRQTLLDAQADPEAYRDLIVRVAGYSDYFRNLSRALQDEIILRTQQQA